MKAKKKVVKKVKHEIEAVVERLPTMAEYATAAIIKLGKLKGDVRLLSLDEVYRYMVIHEGYKGSVTTVSNCLYYIKIYKKFVEVI